MYAHPKENPWKSLPATVVGLLLVASLFCVLPFTNHVSYQRLMSTGGLSPVPTSPPPTVDVAAADVAGIQFQQNGEISMPIPSAATQENKKVELEPVTIPTLEPFAPSDKRQAAFVFDVADLDVPPVPIHRVAPVYPEHLRAQDLEGMVMVEFKVDETGRVLNAVILEETHPDFGRSVVAAVLRWKFLPGTVKGKEVNFRVRLPVSFRLDGLASAERNAFKLVSGAGDRR